MRKILLLMAPFLLSGSAQVKEESIQEKLDRAQKHPVIEELFTSVSGFGIPQEEKDLITQKGGIPTYGEILPSSLQTILNDLHIKEGQTFYDLGSGVGKSVVQAFLEYPFSKAVGIELSPTRFKQAEVVAQKLKNRTLEFRNEDFVMSDISDADVIYMASTCYPDELMNKLLDRFVTLKDGTIIISLRSLPHRALSLGFKLINKYSLPMTWIERNSVYVYKLNKPAQ